MKKGPPPIEPITADSLPEFCKFLAENMGASRTPDEWLAGFDLHWDGPRPNFGFLFRDDTGAIAGGLGAIYSRQAIRGNHYDFCNLTSWCVKEPYRAQSMRLAMALTAQPGLEFTNFSPTKVVAGVLRFLNFRELDERVTFFPNLPSFRGLLGGVSVTGNRGRIQASLDGELARIYRDHARYPWLRFLLLDANGEKCLAIFKRTRVKGVPGARLLYISDRLLYGKYFGVVSGRLLRLGLSFTQIESRLLTRRPPFAKEVGGYTRKLFSSRTLSAEDIECIYSETVCLDL